jgi:hypothetical protein
LTTASKKDKKGMDSKTTTRAALAPPRLWTAIVAARDLEDAEEFPKETRTSLACNDKLDTAGDK